MFKEKKILVQANDEIETVPFLWDSTIPSDPDYPLFLLRDFLAAEGCEVKPWPP
ncbi:MAG: hypothetical protein K1X28_02595 [Parachlamydiales bacterium]|nr:hypothetical protein [Parachlamydiales bacterium]